MRRLLVQMALLALVAGACTAGNNNAQQGPVANSSNVPHTPTTLTMWVHFSGRELNDLNAIVDQFHQQYPWITVKTVGAKNEQETLQAINSGSPPDVMSTQGPDQVAQFCSSHAWIDLNPYLKADGIDLAKIAPPAATKYTSYQGIQCALPLESDAYGLYYNKDMFAKAGITSPPKTLTELVADAKLLTQYNSDGSIKVAGFDPLSDFYESYALYLGSYWGAHWFDSSGQAMLGTDPKWQQMLQWDSQMVGAYGSNGYQKLEEFLAGLGGANSEWSSKHAFENGQVAMMIDGEWRTAFIKADGSNINYGTAPFPTADPSLYGSGLIGGTVIAISGTTPHPEQAWLLVKYLATETKPLEALAEKLGNVPTTYAALKDPVLTSDPHFKPFLDIFANKNSVFEPPLTPIGTYPADTWGNFQTKWEAGNVSSLQSGLQGVATQIDNQLKLGA
ncbi:MAG: extracellular solute-binding protein [Actinomycetota bacterium]|nr:extracellular solute-binding protein [Actinomycetota bacterium]